MAEELFKALDLDQDGMLSREELHEAANLLGWGWRHAPFLAVLDLLTIPGPLARAVFVEVMHEIQGDPNGPYGQILLRSPVPWKPATLPAGHVPLSNKANQVDGSGESRSAGCNEENEEDEKDEENEEEKDGLVSLLRRITNPAVADRYGEILEKMKSSERSVDSETTALLIIDPQRSFTKGAWMRSIGAGAEDQVMPIQLAFRNCARVLRETKGRIETMFSRCPFPPQSYDWDDQVADAVDPRQLYFVKPGNSILWPPTNGFQDWVKGLLARGITQLVIGGCTLNSCVRVSAVEVRQRFADSGLQVTVDLDLCGGRTGNYMESAEFDGLSSVESAVREMVSAGVRISPRLAWP